MDSSIEERLGAFKRGLAEKIQKANAELAGEEFRCRVQ